MDVKAVYKTPLLFMKPMKEKKKSTIINVISTIHLCFAKATWTIKNIPDVWDESVKKVHPHSKPLELQKQLILATTNDGDFVCDPASGGYSVFKACKETGRNFIGGDIEFGE